MNDRINQTEYKNVSSSEKITPAKLEALSLDPISLSLELKGDLILKNFMFIREDGGGD